MCQLNECTQPSCQCLPFQTSEMGDIHVQFIRPIAPTPRSELSKLQNLHKNSAKKFITWTDRHYRMDVMDNSTDEWCKRLWVCVHVKDDFLSIQFDCRLYICAFQCVSSVKITSNLMLLCWIYKNFPIFDFFYILQGSVVHSEKKLQLFYCTFIAECEGKRIFKIGRHLAKLRTKNIVGFFDSQCIYICLHECHNIYNGSITQ